VSVSGARPHTVAQLTGLDLRPARTRPTRRLSAWVRGPWIDAQLAAGVPPWQTPSHAARALQLTSRRRRRVLAQALERLVEDARRPRTPLFDPSIRPRHDQVVPATPLMRSIAARLRSRAPVDARGIAALKAVLGDGGGPCYARGRPGALTTELETVSAWLDVQD
jgi:hypothetical protein